MRLLGLSPGETFRLQSFSLGITLGIYNQNVHRPIRPEARESGLIMYIDFESDGLCMPVIPSWRGMDPEAWFEGRLARPVATWDTPASTPPAAFGHEA